MKGLKVPLIEIGIAGVIIGLAIWFRLLGLGEAIQILLMLGLVFVTAWYAESTHRMAKAMEAESATRRPYLNLDNWHLPDPTNLNRWRVNLTNFGNTPAYAVQLDLKPRVSGYQGTLPVQVTSASPIIMPGQWNQHTIDLDAAPQIASKQYARLEIEFVIQYRNAASKPFKAWELRLVRTPEPTVSNWLLVGEDSEKELVTGV